MCPEALEVRESPFEALFVPVVEAEACRSDSMPVDAFECEEWLVAALE